MNETNETDNSKHELIKGALGLFASAIEALKRAGLIVPGVTDMNAAALDVAPATSLAPLSQAEAEFAVPPVAADPLPDTAPARDSKGHFLPRGATPKADVPARVRKPKVAKAAKVERKPAPNLVDEFVRWFYTAPEAELYSVKRGQYECRLGSGPNAHTLLFHSEATESDWDPVAQVSRSGKVQPKDANNVIGIRPIGGTVGVFNASRIQYGTSHAEQKRPQLAAERAGAVPVPFENVVSKGETGVGLDLAKLKVVEWTGAEDMIIPPVGRSRQWQGDFFVVSRHFAGAMVLEIEGKYFLFDCDRNELKRFNFNPFFSLLPGPAKTVEEAYGMLMPEPVARAYMEGRDVKRQGEYFFVPATDEELLALRRSQFAKDYAFDMDEMLEFLRATFMLSEVGAAQLNWQHLREQLDVERFVRQCGGVGSALPPATTGQPVVNTTPVGELFGQYIEELTPRVGGALAQGKFGDLDMFEDAYAMAAVAEKKQQYAASIRMTGARGVNTHLSNLANQLNTLCLATMNRETNTLEPSGPLSKDVGVYFNVNIGSQDELPNQRQHSATGVWRVKADAKNVETRYLAIGTVTHGGREHHPLYLPTWHFVYPNSGVLNLTVSGKVD